MAENKKKIFADFYDLEIMKKQKMEELKDMEEEALCIGSPSNISGERVKTSAKTGSRQEEAVIAIEMKRGEIVDLILDIEKKQKKIERMISKLRSEKERTMMRYRYINGYTFEKIGELMNYSTPNIYYTHKKAMEYLTKGK